MIEALRAALERPSDDGFTVTELLAQLGLSPSKHAKDKVRAFLRVEIASGRVASVMGRRLSITGHPVAIPIYVPMKTKAKR